MCGIAKREIYIYIVWGVYIKRKLAEEEIILRERFENTMLLALKLGGNIHKLRKAAVSILEKAKTRLSLKYSALLTP